MTLEKTQGLPQKPKSDGDSDEIFEDEARHIRKVVLCVLLDEWRAVLGKVAEDSRIINLSGTFPPLRLNLSCFHECHLCKGRADQFIYKYGKQNNVTDYFAFV